MTTLPQRFWDKVEFDGPEIRSGLGPCWLWTAYKNRKGYGKFLVGSRTDDSRRLVSTHRLSLEAVLGSSFRSDLFVCHRCDNPSCVRPSHLFQADNVGNMADMVEKGRQSVLAGVANGNHKLSQADADAIRGASGTYKDVAARFGISFAHVGRIKRGDNWKEKDTR